MSLRSWLLLGAVPLVLVFAVPRASIAQLSIHEMHVTVARHAATSLLFDPNEALADATARIENANGTCEDVACCLVLRNPNTLYGWFGSTGDGLDIVTTEQELLDVTTLGGLYSVKVVTSMSGVCGASPGGVINGCTGVGSRRDYGQQNTVITCDVGAAVWAHEFGHAQGKQHYSSTCLYRIMREPTWINANAVTGSEGTLFRANPSTMWGTCSGAIPSAFDSYFVPQTQASPSSPVFEGLSATRYFVACPNNHGGTSLPNNARIKVVLKDINGSPIGGVSAGEIYAKFNGGTGIQGFSGDGADSIIANSTWNQNPSCPDVRYLYADDTTDGNGVTYITFTGTTAGSPGFGTRDASRKWGHYDSDIPVYARGVRLSGRLTSSSPNPPYDLRIKNFDVSGGLSASLNLGERVTPTDYNTVVANLYKSNAITYWIDFNGDGVVDTLDFNMLMAHFEHNCGTPYYP